MPGFFTRRLHTPNFRCFGTFDSLKKIDTSVQVFFGDVECSKTLNDQDRGFWQKDLTHKQGMANP